MAPRQLMVRWRKDKARRYKTRPKAFAQKALSGVNNKSKSGNSREASEHGIFSNDHRGAGGAERNFKTLKHFIDTRRPHHRYLYQFFGPAVMDAAEALAGDPKMAVELLLERYVAQDPVLDVFRYESVCLERSPIHELYMFFRGRECFLIYRKKNELRMSRTYMSLMYLKNLPTRKVEWAGEPVYLNSSVDHDEQA